MTPLTAFIKHFASLGRAPGPTWTTLDEATIDDFYDRFDDLVSSTKDIGWGFHDLRGVMPVENDEMNSKKREHTAGMLPA